MRWVREGRVAQEFRDDTGCRAIFDRAAASGQADRATFYQQFLRKVLALWEPDTREIPLVISGMASSTIGWKELPYAPAPLRLDGTNLRFEFLTWDKPGWLGHTY